MNGKRELREEKQSWYIVIYSILAEKDGLSFSKGKISLCPFPLSFQAHRGRSGERRTGEGKRRSVPRGNAPKNNTLNMCLCTT